MTQQLIKRLEKSLKAGVPVEEEELFKWKQTHDWLFGAKHSLTDTLRILTDLLLLLEKVEAARPAAKGEHDEPKFNDADVALVKAFIDKSAQAAHVV